jgi:hypothetical protein
LGGGLLRDSIFIRTDFRSRPSTAASIERLRAGCRRSNCRAVE